MLRFHAGRRTDLDGFGRGAALGDVEDDRVREYVCAVTRTYIHTPYILHTVDIYIRGRIVHTFIHTWCWMTVHQRQHVTVFDGCQRSSDWEADSGSRFMFERASYQSCHSGANVTKKLVRDGGGQPCLDAGINTVAHGNNGPVLGCIMLPGCGGTPFPLFIFAPTPP